MPRYDMTEILKDHFFRIGITNRYNYPTEPIDQVKTQEYMDWCRKYGFPQTMKKTPFELKKERETYIVRKATTTLKASNKRDPKKPFQDMIDGTYSEKSGWKAKRTGSTMHYPCPRCGGRVNRIRTVINR